MFGVFLFLTYYLQQTLGFSAVQSGLAFLPMTIALMVMAQVGTNVLSRKVGPRFIVAPGLLLGAIGLVMLTRISPSTHYVSGVLPATIVFGIGLGLAFSSAMSIATAGVAAEDAGVASAMVNTGQQVGGSIGTALLNTLAATAAANYIHSHAAGAKTAELASIHSYTVAFWISAAILGAGAVITAIVLRSEVPAVDPDAVPIV
jgi:MFS family permease